MPALLAGGSQPCRTRGRLYARGRRLQLGVTRAQAAALRRASVRRGPVARVYYYYYSKRVYHQRTTRDGRWADVVRASRIS